MDQPNQPDTDRYRMIANLEAAVSALRGYLHLYGVDPTGRAHMERALAHVREACIAINEAGRSRTVQQLTDDLIKAERLCEALRRKPSSSRVIKPIRI